MNKEPVDIERFLPFGEMLRGFVEQPFVTKSDVSDVLRSRGVFVNPNDKKETIPWLMNMLLSPDEFDRLRESQKTKEDNPKINTQTIPWASDDSLIDSVPDNFDINAVLDLEFSNFSVVGSPNFVPLEDDSDHVILDFEIERRDYSKNWASTESVYKGSLELQKIEDGDSVKLVVTHTADETRYVANKAASGLVKHFKKRGCVSESANIQRILFNKFDNCSRIDYFLSLSRDITSSVFSFKDVVDIEFSPEGDRDLPEGMEWMEKRIEDLRVNGKSLHETLFITDSEYHPYLHLYHMETRFEFDYKGLKGECVISAGFPDYGKSKKGDAEFEVNVKSFKCEKSSKVSRAEIGKFLLREFDRLKLESFEKAMGDASAGG